MFRLILLVIAIVAGRSYADVTAYNGSQRVFARKGESIFLHEHDYSVPKYISGKEHVSYVELLDAKNGKSLFRVRSQPFSYVWLSDDERFAVALSTLKLNDVNQLVVYDRSGREVFAAKVACKDLPIGSCSESITNYVQWFDEKRVHVSVQKFGNALVISVDEMEFRVEAR